MKPAVVTLGSLFAGIGGLELGLEAAFREAGIDVSVAWQVEREPFCRAILAKHWPHANRSVTDVRRAGIATLPRVDGICGGFPCQDISYAGGGAGLAGERSGLWFEFARIIREMGPRFVVVENVAALATRGLDAVLGTLADDGYDARWYSLRASDVGAPHRRERIFIVAHAQRWRFKTGSDAGSAHGPRSGVESAEPEPRGVAEAACDDGQVVANANAARRYERSGACRKRTGGAKPPNGAETLADAHVARPQGRGQPERGDTDERPAWQGGAQRYGDRRQAGDAESGVGRDAHGLSKRLDGHRWPAPPGEEQYIDEPPRTVKKAENRAACLRALGNAVSPQCSLRIGRELVDIMRVR